MIDQISQLHTTPVLQQHWALQQLGNVGHGFRRRTDDNLDLLTGIPGRGNHLAFTIQP
ncbi:hypothetical protein SDC9_176956 [bioreactor metagenome]|uniref:Uncharacterized protein n=1 Tax=bioreactor metagenome TaxID=1076179 RepID=A0A645H0V7_9ZZZZ